MRFVCSRIDESVELSNKSNQTINPETGRFFRTIALNGEATEEERQRAFERLAMDENMLDTANQSNAKQIFDTEGKITSLTGGEKWVTAHLHDGNKFSAIVTPGKYQANEVFMRITLNGKEYNVSIKIDTEFYEGYRHQFHLKMGKKKCDLVPVSEDNLSGWTTEEELK